MKNTNTTRSKDGVPLFFLGRISRFFFQDCSHAHFIDVLPGVSASLSERRGAPIPLLLPASPFVGEKKMALLTMVFSFKLFDFKGRPLSRSHPSSWLFISLTSTSFWAQQCSSSSSRLCSSVRLSVCVFVRPSVRLSVFPSVRTYVFCSSKANSQETDWTY